MKKKDYRMLAAAPPEGTPLCATSEINDGQARVFSFRKKAAIFEMFVLRAPKHVEVDAAKKTPSNLYAYVNECPHTGSPLDWRPGQFLDTQKCLLVCGTHGALFRIADGFCVEGPCSGEALIPVDVFIENGFLHTGRRPSITEVE